MAPQTPQTNSNSLSPISFLRSFSRSLVLVCVALRPIPALPQDIEYRDLPELLESGVAAFSRGDFPQAAHLFNVIRADYQEEPEWTDGALPKKLLPLAGFASLKSGSYADAADSLQLYLENYAETETSASFARYLLAITLHRKGDEESAQAAFEQLRMAAGRTALRDLAALRQARLSSDEAATELLLQLIDDPVSQRFAILAKLDLIQRAIDRDEPSIACTLLLDTNWSQAEMPELATLSHLAFSLGDSLLDTRPDLALAAFRRVSPLRILIEEQSELLDRFRATIEDRTPTLSVQQSLWSDFYRESLHSLERQLRELKACQDYADALALRKAICFSELNRPLEAWILLEALSQSADPEIAPKAHLRWIATARSMQAWSAAAAIAQRYVQLYPDRDDADQALYWIAQSQIDARRFESAIDTLRALIGRTDSQSLQASAKYLTGFSLVMMNRIPEAIASFESVTRLQPGKSTSGQARLWIGICNFLQSEFTEAIAQFEAVAAEPGWSFLHPDATYRKACGHYALEENEQALDVLNGYFDDYADHPRSDEARLLQGDLLNELNRPSEALSSYHRVSETDRDLRFQAVAKSVEILLSQSEPRTALQLLETFSTQPIPPSLAGAFANSKADCLLELGEASAASAFLKNAVTSYGRDRQSGDIDPLIQRITADDPETLSRWIDEAKHNSEDTLLARLRFRFSEALLKLGRITESQLQTLKLASDFDPQILPPECLVAAGLALLEIGSLDAKTYFNQALSEFPDSEYSSLASYGLGLDAAQRGDSETALARLSSLELSELPIRTLGPALLLTARLHAEQDELDAAVACYESILSDRALKPAVKASALLGLGETLQRQKKPDAAYACFQRIFTLYRAEKALVANSYLRCAEILSQLSRYEDAHSVCQEFLEQPDLISSTEYPAILQLSEDLATRLAAHANRAP